MKKKFKVFVLSLTMLVLVGILSGCSEVGYIFTSMKGSLVGNSYTIWEYDNFGNRVLTLSGEKISMEGSEDSNGELTSYVNITVDGYEWNHVGDTLLFVPEGVDMVTDFEIPNEVVSNGNSTGFMPTDRVINSFRNSFGKSSVVVVYSQLGVPICIFEGDDCYVKESEDLPKTTEIYIDDYLLYVHRANIDIFPTALISGNTNG